MNLTLFGCGSLCRRQATGGAVCLRRAEGVAGSKSRGQHLANSRRRPQSCRLCNIAGQILVNKQSYSNSNNNSKQLQQVAAAMLQHPKVCNKNAAGQRATWASLLKNFERPTRLPLVLYFIIVVFACSD